MKAVNQTKCGGPKAMIQDRGDCWNACLASLLEVPITAVSFTHSDDRDHHWWDETQRVLKPHGYEAVIASKEVYPGGYWIATVPSKNLGVYDDGQPVLHTIVMCAGEVAHDPCLGETYQVGTPIAELEVHEATVLVPLQIQSLAD